MDSPSVSQLDLFGEDIPESLVYPSNLVYFSESEFRRATPSCSLMDMKPSFMYELDRLRKFLGFPLFINSAFRTYEYELSKGRQGTSSHCKGLAVDIACYDSDKRYKIISAALSELFSFQRIGIAETFIHLDMDKDKPNSIWLY